MYSTQVDSIPETRQVEFQISYIWAALAVAVFMGFAIGTHLSFVIGFDFQLGDGFVGYIQTHGHVQLVGWVGLFIMGISLHFLPRLAGVPITHQHWLKWILRLVTSGLVLRSVGHSIIPYIVGSRFFAPVSWMVFGSSLFLWFAILLYAALLIHIFRRIDSTPKRPALSQIAPYFLMMLAGWLIYMTLNLILIFHMVFSKAVTLNPAWNEFAIQVFVGLVLLPVIFVFSLRTFPLFLRLPSTNWHIRGVAWAYLFSFCLQLLPTMPSPVNLPSGIAPFLSTSGAILKSLIVLWIVWQLDILTRLKKPWTVDRILEPGADRKATRNGLPDYGEFGRFERLLVASYSWLALGAMFEISYGTAALFGLSTLHVSDAIRHIYLLGFATNLIFGMSVRMIPGFIGKKRIASNKLVDATFYLVNSAAICRILPLVLPESFFWASPLGVEIAKAAFAFSGVFGMAALICLWMNLRKTVISMST